jgi:antitoxin PrlF
MGSTAQALRSTLGSTMTSKGQVTVPAQVRKELNLNPGERVVFRKKDGQYFIESADAWVERTAGMLSYLAEGKPPATIEEWEEAAAAGWADESFEPTQ